MRIEIRFIVVTVYLLREQILPGGPRAVTQWTPS